MPESAIFLESAGAWGMGARPMVQLVCFPVAYLASGLGHENKDLENCIFIRFIYSFGSDILRLTVEV